MGKAPARAAARELPASFPLSTKEEIDGYTIIDANNDGKTWKYELSSACYESLSTDGADDWLILPALNFTSASATYTLSIQAKQTYLPETFEVCISPTDKPADATPVYSCPSLTNDWAPYNTTFNVPTAGNYYVMVHATTPGSGISLYVRNIEVGIAEDKNYTVPFAMTPEPTEAGELTFIDANTDGKTWSYDISNTGVSYHASTTNAADDYLLLPPINVSEAGNYKFGFEVKGYGSYLESVEVLMGTGDDPSAFACIYADSQVSSAEFRREVVVNIAEPGAVRFALHASSPANLYNILARNFTLDATDESVAAPLPMTDERNFPLIAGTPAFSHAFLLPANTRVKVSLESKGAPVKVSLAKAPAEASAVELFSTESAEDFTTATHLFNATESGLRYLMVSAEAEATVRNLSISIYTEADDARQLPFNMQPTAEEVTELRIINANNDESVWSYYEPFGAMRYNFGNNKADDWLILPAVNVPDTKQMLSFSLRARGMSVNLPEKFEVWAGQSPDPAKMTLLFTSPEIRTEEFIPVSFSFAPARAGVTYLAVRAVSEPKMFHLFVRDFSLVAESRSSAVPRPVSDLEAHALPQGSTRVEVTFTLPLLSENGMPLDRSTLHTATVTSVGTATVIGLPGATLTAEVENGQGLGTVTVTVTGKAGTSNPATVSVYTGQDVPSPVEALTLTASEDNRTVHLSWASSSVGLNGGYADPSLTTYTILHSAGNGSYTKAGSVSDATEWDYTIPDSYPLQMHYFIVQPSNVAGAPEVTSGTGVMLGKPLDVPYDEEFAEGTISNGPIGMATPDERYTLDWYFDNPALAFDESANTSGLALIAFTEEPGPARGRLHLPKVDTRTDKGARIVLRVYNFPHFAPTDVYGLTAGQEPVLIGRIEPTTDAGWREYSLPLPVSLMGKQWVEPYLDFGFDGTADDEIWMLDKYGIQHYFDTELDLRPVVVHSRLKARETSKWQFKLANYGRNAVSIATPSLNFTTLGGEVTSFAPVYQTDAELTLQPGELLYLNYDVTLDAALEGTLAYDLSVAAEGDGNPDNDYVAGELTLWMQKEYVVRDLRASRAEGSDLVTLSWSAPTADLGRFDCEDLESWDLGPELGLFSNYDADALPTLSFVGATYPGMGLAKAWQVWDAMDAGFDVIYLGYLGSDKSLIVFGPGDGRSQADDWLISPEVEGGTSIDFEVRPLIFDYGREKIEILYSSTGTNLSDFTLLDTYLTKEGEKGVTPYWEHVSVTLPEDARYFAIRYVSRNIFGLQLDVIEYTPAQTDAGALTYTVLRDGEPIATGVDATTYTDNFSGAATYHVAAEKAYGSLHPLSNMVMVGTAGVDVVEAGIRVYSSKGNLIVAGCEGRALSVNAADGKVVYTTASAPATLRLPLNAGLYIVTAPGQTAVKALVP